MNRFTLVFLAFFSLFSACLMSAPVSDGQSVTIRSANIILKVPDYQTACDQVTEMSNKHGAILLDARTEVNYRGDKNGDMVFRIKAGDLDTLVGELHGIGKLYSEHIQTTDNTPTYEDLQSRIGILKQNETSLLGFLDNPRKMRGSDILFIQYRLFQNRMETANAEQQSRDLLRSSGRSIVHVSLFEPDPKSAADWGNWRALASFRGKQAFYTSIRKIVTGLYFLVWMAPFWVPVLVVVFLIIRGIRKRYRRRIKTQQTNESKPA